MTRFWCAYGTPDNTRHITSSEPKVIDSCENWCLASLAPDAEDFYIGVCFAEDTFWCSENAIKNSRSGSAIIKLVLEVKCPKEQSLSSVRCRTIFSQTIKKQFGGIRRCWPASDGRTLIQNDWTFTSESRTDSGGGEGGLKDTVLHVLKTRDEKDLVSSSLKSLYGATVLKCHNGDMTVRTILEIFKKTSYLGLGVSRSRIGVRDCSVRFTMTTEDTWKDFRGHCLEVDKWMNTNNRTIQLGDSLNPKIVELTAHNAKSCHKRKQSAQGQRDLNCVAIATHGQVYLKGSDSTPSKNWFKMTDRVIDVMRRSENTDMDKESYRRVRIAVLDTGLKEDRWSEVSYRDFVDSSSQRMRKDYTAHGTISVDLILKMYRDADLYVARVFETNLATSQTEHTQMAKAIRWAMEMKVDIISISAGFKYDYDDLRHAVEDASDSKVLIFAAASNWGNIESGVAFPAHIKDNVFCIFSSNGALQASSLSMNPKPRDDADNFAVLGENVDVYPGSGQAPVQGSSMATALAAGLAARILDFSSHEDNCKAGGDAPKLRERLQRRSGMRAVLKRIARVEGKFHCVAPWLLWQDPVSTTPKEKPLTRERILEVLLEAHKQRD